MSEEHASIEQLEGLIASLSDEVGAMTFSDPVAYVYNPLSYAREPHFDYLGKYGTKRGRVLLVGMNPGPFGMAQTGVPFGDVEMVRDWMGIRGHVGTPPAMHPKRPVDGFAHSRSEVSGTRLWGWARDRWGSADAFFGEFFVHNCVPLLFVHESGRNLTPDKLSLDERAPLLEASHRTLRSLVELLEPRMVVGIGVFAEKQAATACSGLDVPIGRILHPSPASPKANRGWAAFADEELSELGIIVPEA